MNLPIPALRSLFLCSFAAGALSPLALAFDPGWWTARGVVSGAPDDYAKLNVGQLKNMAAKARDELNANLPNGAGSLIDTMVTTWASTTNDDDDYAVCNLGQLKAVAKLYWDRVIAEGSATAIPWSELITTDDDSYAAANLGQLKVVFRFAVGDKDVDGMADSWEMQWFGNLSRDGTLDADGDGFTDLEEFQLGLNPTVNDSTAATKTLTYDVLGRLQSAGATTYTYDAEGNIQSAAN